MTQIFFIDCLRPTDFTDLHRFFLIDYFSPTDFTELRRFFLIVYFSHGFHRITQIFYERFLPLKLLRTKADSQFLQRDSVAV